MALRVYNVALTPDEPEALLPEKAAARLGIPASAILGLRVVRRSVDARRGRVRIVYGLELSLGGADAESAAVRRGARRVAEPQAVRPRPGREEIGGRAVVAGCGPAGLFAALQLARYGYRPLVIERGAPVAQRHADVARFHATRRLDPESNLVFGAGGAGAYSDGKLRTRIRDPRVATFFDWLVAAGAPEAMRVDARPHLGTDGVCKVVAGLCDELVSAGGEIAWHTHLTGLGVEGGRLRAVRAPHGEIETNCLILATGANARDTFAAMMEDGVAMAAKPFQMGVRIEHPRELIDGAIFGKHAGDKRLGAAGYVLSAEGVAAFCVCPGGALVAASAEPGAVCTNGMSLAARDGAFTNAALVTTVSPGEFGAAGGAEGNALGGLACQRACETRAFASCGGDYSAPAQNVRDFLRGRCGPIVRGTTYPLGVRAVALDKIVPASVGGAIRRALPSFDRRIPGFAGDAGVLVGPEARVSCPVRMVRHRERGTSVSVDGVYPAGEGSGYSSGIVSSAVDGLKAADAVIARFRPPV